MREHSLSFWQTPVTGDEACVLGCSEPGTQVVDARLCPRQPDRPVPDVHPNLLYPVSQGLYQEDNPPYFPISRIILEVGNADRFP